MAATPRPISILCLGDSLTWGYHNRGHGKHPYSALLQARVGAALGRTVDVITSGVPGDTTSRGSLQRRLQRQCEARFYDWVIVLGGTNGSDLAFAIPAHDILDALRACWNTALAHGSSVLALTVPECSATSKSLHANRHALNSAILAHSQPNFYVLDLCAKMPYHALSQEDRGVLWDDGIHLTPEGYDRMGHHIASSLLQIASSLLQILKA